MPKKFKPRKLIAGPIERYPHTHFGPEVDSAWLYQCYGILRAWDKSLTRMLQKLSLIENHDVSKIVAELIYLSDKIDDWINKITDAEKLIASSEASYQAADIESTRLLNALCSDLNGFILKYTPLMTEVLECIEGRLKLHDQQLADLGSTLEDLQRQIDDLSSQIDALWQAILDMYEANAENAWISMSEGVDYDLYWFNNFTSTHSPKITYRDSALKTSSKTYHNITVKINCKGDTSLTNTNVYSSSVQTPKFRHASSTWDVPESWIFSVGFRDDLFKGYQGYDQKDAVWNMFPRSQRASWAVTSGANACVASNPNGNKSDGKGLLIYMRSIDDGYNQQYYNHYDDGLYFGLLNLELEAFYMTTVTTG